MRGGNVSNNYGGTYSQKKALNNVRALLQFNGNTEKEAGQIKAS